MRPRAYLMLFTLALIRGASFLFMQMGVQEMPPQHSWHYGWPWRLFPWRRRSRPPGARRWLAAGGWRSLSRSSMS